MAQATPPTTVRTRFAPSPSGHLHVGGARTALFCWAFARGRGGKFLLRIEDTDQKRSSDSASMAFLEDLKWLGIDWDEGPEFEGCGGGSPEHGPYFQSQRLDIYNKYIGQLIAEGKAYRAFETPEELAAIRAKAMAEKRNPRYDRSALRLSPEAVRSYVDEGRPHVVRFKIPDAPGHGPVIVNDAVRGEVVTELSELDDFVIRKADGYPMYNFAVVVDDELMGVTHVLRAQEHLSNTPKQILLAEALGFRQLTFAHVSLITNPDGSKMSKRDKDKALRAEVKGRLLTDPPNNAVGQPIVSRDRWDWWLLSKDNQLDLLEAERLAQVLGVELPEINVDDFRKHGYLPEVMINYLALLGWNPGGDIEKFDREFLILRFDLDRIIKSPAKFDREKLLAFNNDAIQAMSPEEFEQRFREHCQRYHPEFIEQLSPEQFRGLARANQARSKTLENQIASSRFFIMSDDEITYEQSKSVEDALSKGSPCGYDHLEAVLQILRGLDAWTIQSIEAAVKQYADAHADGKLGKVAQPLRIAVSGGTISPAIFDTLAILGKDSTLRRIERCLSLRLQRSEPQRR
jgi:glutamyl/glutaminyl-tRNA synthetase